MTESRTLTFHIADSKGRPSIRTTDGNYAEFLVAQGKGWTVTDIVVS